MRYRTDGSTAVAPIPLEPGDTADLHEDDGTVCRWEVQAVTEHFAALTRPVTDDDRAEIAAEYDHPDSECPDFDLPPGVDDTCDHISHVSDPPDVFEGAVYYTVLDWWNGVRGASDRVFPMWSTTGTYTADECAAMLADFEAGTVRVSQRNWTPIRFAAQQPAPGVRSA